MVFLFTTPVFGQISKTTEHIATHPAGVLSTDGDTLEVGYEVVFL
jgi:hypothetical protein